MAEKLVLVNEKDKVIGLEDKLKCHLGKGLLHRAFSIYIFKKTKKGRVLFHLSST
jgi:isopentenyl-diphosphate delta-isomerase